MKSSKGDVRHRLWLGVAALGVFVFGLSLQGAPRFKPGSTPLQLDAKGTSGALSAGAETSPSDASPTVFAGPNRVKAGTLPRSSEIKVVNRVTADYRDDRGTREREQGILFGPLPYLGGGNVATCGLPACSFAIECDDANPCTVDTCNIVAGTGPCTGTCDHDPVPNGQGAACDDGLTCNGFETCQGSVCAVGSARNVGLPCDEHSTCRTLGVCAAGICTTGLPGEACVDDNDCAFPLTGTCSGGVCENGTSIVCCSTVGSETVCTENVAKCSDSSDNPGLGCTSDAQCRNGQCEFCQPGCTADVDCDDGLKCNGAERCLAGVCDAGLYNPCGAGATCSEGDCTTTGRNLCNTDTDCVSPATCNKTGAAYCALGRCCSDIAEPACGKLCLDTDARFGLVCNTSCPDTSFWFAGDTGEQPAEGACGGNDATASTPDAWECPKYSSGFVQKTITDVPVYTIAVGPVSDSPQIAPAPNGPGTKFHAIGDDYTFENASHIGVDVVRWVGEVIAGNRISMEFYDGGGIFIEDIVLPPLGGGFGVHVVTMTPSLTLPPTGFVVMRVASDFSANTRFVVAATDNTDVGSNNAAQLWVYNGANGPNGAPVPNFLTGGNPGILAIEMAGDKESAPTGACCNALSGECKDGELSWVCPTTGGIWTQGALCAACNGGGNAGGACRRCSNNTSLACTSDAGCTAGGSCNVFNGAPDPCPGSVCTAGDVGESCTTGTDCNVSGTCCLTGIGCLLNTCTQGNLSLPFCDDNADCSITGVCGAATCVALDVCGSGACCAASGTCSISSDEATCEATVGSVWQGFNTDCDPNCCTVPGVPGGPAGTLCMGGPNNLDACSANIDCGACKGGSANGGACDDEADCPNSAGPVVPDGTCIENPSDPPIPAMICAGGLTPGSPCSNSYDCGGSVGTCVGSCVTRGTGANNAWDAYVHMITVPTDATVIEVVTISGNNNPASASAEQPDGCFGFNAAAVNNDPGWFEAFHLNACARVRIDTCCSNPIKQPMWAFISTDPECNNNLGAQLDPFSVIAQGLNARGAPYCDEDNLWTTYGLLPAGTYYQPVLSSLSGAHGPYQLHITVQSCPKAACCSNACTGGPSNGLGCRDDIDCGTCTGGPSNGLACGQNLECGTCAAPHAPTACDSNADCAPQLCTPGTCTAGACDAKCTELNSPDCEAIDGFYQGPPNAGVSTPLCQGSPGVCADGSCCTGPGLCQDRRNTAGNVPMTRALCEAIPNGVYTGGVQCSGGRCTGGACTGVLSCADVTGCECGGVTGCTGDTSQANPCPLCEYISNDTCQRDPGAFIGTMYLADVSSTVSPTRIADDVLLTESGSLTSVCVIGSYVDFTGGAHYCGAATHSAHTETFTVRVFATASAVDYTPGAQIGTSVSVPASSFAKKQEYISGGYTFFRHQLNLSPPIPGLVAGNVYWIQVDNNTAGGESGCNWFWLNASAGEGNDLFFQDLGEFYSAADAEDGDISMCINLGFETPPSPTRACCTCDPVTPCQVLNFLDCTALGGNWRLDILDCSGTLPLECQNLPPANDECADAFVVSNGKRDLKNFCAATDGPAEVDCVVNDPPDPATSNAAPFENDVWFHYTATCSGTATVTTCDNDRGFDTVIAVYYDTASSAVCPCPTDNSLLLGTCSDDDTGACDSFFGVSTVEVPVTQGDCYTIRVGGFNGAQGNARLSISCGVPPTCGNNVNEPQGGEQCDGTDSTNCPGQCRPPSDDNGCTCNTTCGNSIVEFGEQCDGVASTNCLPSDCRTPSDPAGGCSCLPCCGNGVIDAGELCDPGDPAGAPDVCTPGTATAVNGVCTGGCTLSCSCITNCGNGTKEIGEDCDATDDALCPTRCGSPLDIDPLNDCKCPPATCGNDYVETLANGEECDGDDLTGDGACPSSECRPAGDPAGECTCACQLAGTPPMTPVWDSSTTSPARATRSLSFSLTAVAASGGEPSNAIQIRMIDLQNPNPANPGTNFPPNFGSYEVATCTAAGETAGCARWVGPMSLFQESQDNVLLGTFRAARLQCTPYYYDWTLETGGVVVFGAEIVPSSTYHIVTYGSACKGSETGCTQISAPVTALTRRSGDASTPFNPPALSDQPNGIDVSSLVDKFKNSAGAITKKSSQIFGNFVELNLDVSGLDISAAVDAFKGAAYPYSGPCACPSAVVCATAAACATAATCSGGLCIKSCVGGAHIGRPCLSNAHCPGSTCGTGFCRDRCGRCN